MAYNPQQGTDTQPTNQPQVQPGRVTAAAPNSAFTPGGFRNIVGRDPNQQETAFYGGQPDWEANVRNATPKSDQVARDDQGNPVNSMGGAHTNAPQAPTSPVSATGGIPPPAQAPPATASAPGERRDARTPEATAAMPTYTPYQVTQYHAPDQSHVNDQQTNLLNAIMAHPETLDANTIAQMKEQQKEQALLLGQQNMGQFAQSAVGRGTLGGGQTNAFRANNNTQVGNQILTGNRNTDLAAVATNRQDQLNALGASSGIAQDQLGRSISAYGTGLQGQMAQAGENQYGFRSQQDANNAAFQRALAMAQNAQSVYGQDAATEFGRNANNLDIQKFLAQQQQFGQNLGFNYDQLGQNGRLAQGDQALRVGGF